MAQAQPNFRIEGEQQFIDPKKLNRNIRPIHEVIFGFIFSPMGFAGFVSLLAVVGFIFPTLITIVFILSLIAGIVGSMMPSMRRQTLPLRLPMEEGDRIDYNAPNPQHRGFRKSEGSFLLGNTWGKKQEIWAAFGDLLTHCLVLGGTGAGKSEQLLSMVYNGLALGGGSVYVDPKGGPKLYGQHWTMLRLLGRDDDMRVLNLALGPDELGATPFIRSNTLQPFAFGKASSLKEIPLSLMAGGGDSNGGNGVFAANAKTLITSLMMGLVDLRDMGEIPLSINDIRNYIQPNAFIELAQRKDIKKDSREAMISFMTSLGWKPDEKDHAKWGDFDRQYSYAQNYFLDVLSTVSDTYRHIFNVPIGDIHMPDVIFQRRCFVAIIPALEKSKAELATLGKITLMILRLGVASGLGDGNIMGNWRQLVDLSLSAARVPAFFFIDEYAAIAVEGFAEVFTQGRGLGVSATVGSQDWAGIKKANEAEAQQIVANTKFKFIMTTDDPNDTKQLIESLSGDAMEMQAQSFAVQGLINYYDTQSATAQRTKRTDQKDFAAQVEGEWHLFFKDKIIRGFGFFAGGVPDDKDTPSFVHHMLMVDTPSKISMSIRFGNLKNTLEKWKGIINEVGDRPIEYPSSDYTGYEGYRPLGDLFRWALVYPQKAGQLNSKRRRELACASVFAWIEADPFELPVSAMPAPVSIVEKPAIETPVEALPPMVDDHQKARLRESIMGRKEETVKKVEPETSLSTDEDPLSALERMSGIKPSQDQENETSESSTVKEAVDEPFDDPLAQLERQFGLQKTPENNAVESDESDKSDEDTVQTKQDDENVEPVHEETFTVHDTLKPSVDMPVFGAGFAALSEALAQDMEDRVERHADVLMASAVAMGNAKESLNLDSLTKDTANRVKASLSNPPYPTPPKPEKKTTSDVRPLAERWVKRIKNG